MKISRRTWMATAAGAAGVTAAARAGSQSGLIPPNGVGIYGPGESLTYSAQRLLTGQALAREFPSEKISAKPYQNGKPPSSAEFTKHVAEGFANWRLEIDGMVDRPVSLSVDDVRSMGAARQITHLACEEGWSYIAEWRGVPLAHLLERAGVHAHARFALYFSIQPSRWDSLDMADALHPQTIVAHSMNGVAIPAGFGAPLRMRVPRQLGYKSIKYLNRITLTDDLKAFRKGLGSGAAEAGYQWYAGI